VDSVGLFSFLPTSFVAAGAMEAGREMLLHRRIVIFTIKEEMMCCGMVTTKRNVRMESTMRPAVLAVVESTLSARHDLLVVCTVVV